MPTDRKLDTTISSWLEAEAPMRMPDRVLSATFEQTRKIRQQGRWHALLRRITVNKLVPISVGAAAVVAVLILGSQALGSPRDSGVGGPGVTPAASPVASVAAPTRSPIASRTPFSAIAPGPYVLEKGATGVGSITVTIPGPGWENPDGILVSTGNNDTGMLTFAGGQFVYGDPCRWSTTKPAKPATTVDEIVAALGSQASRNASAPVDVTVAGHSGKAITLHVPDNAVFTDCDQDTFGLLTDLAEPDSPGRYNQGPGQIDELWVVDVNGVPLSFDLIYWPNTPKDVIDAMHAIVKSATFK